ncbi:MAG: hypothetical protein HYX90_03375 [Chloroflexi bacterium]|nr:hypothetical protein [Chloroflexota bacterium]
MKFQFKSPVRNVKGYWEWYELACKEQWTDGLPVCPPTERKVSEIIEYLGRQPQEIIGTVGPQNGLATIEQVAINCAMAGCTPAMTPVVVAAVKGIVDPNFRLGGVQATTNSCAPLAIVNGPIARRLGFNSGDNAFGGGSRANAAVGRAVRLIMWNIGGGIPGRGDLSTLGSSAKYTFCIAENEEESPWEPFHVGRGLGKEQSAVTVFDCQSPHPINVTGNAERILHVIAADIPRPGTNTFRAAGEFLLAFSARVAQVLARAGYSKADVKQWVWEHARYNLGWLRRNKIFAEGAETAYTYWGHVRGKERPDIRKLGDDAMLPMVLKPDDIHCVVVGTVTSQWWAGFCAGWGNYGGGAITMPVEGTDRGTH